jgi:hypothetical protein
MAHAALPQQAPPAYIMMRCFPFSPRRVATAKPKVANFMQHSASPDATA